MKNSVRTRFAPSPTGFLHVGGIRTALFAWLIARQSGGQFVLRLEDTDKKREVSGSDIHLMKSLRALGLDYDEGPDIGGPFGPYRQSERLDIYLKWAKKLLADGRAYVDPYSPEEVQAFREEAQAARRPFLYRRYRPTNTPKWDGTRPLRFKADPKKYTWHDEVMGDMKAGPESIDDFIIIKSDGFPTYNFAHIVDDFEMQNTHVIRGQEFIASMPNYLNLYEALGINPPVLATMPHILGPDGKKKLSKRDGAKDVLDYIKEGYLPEALRSFIASMGWNDGTEQEIYSTEDLVTKFKLQRVQRGGARFDERRLLWMNGVFIREKLDIRKLYDYSKGNNCFEIDYWPQEAKNFEDSYLMSVLKLTRERLKYMSEIPQLTSFFFEDLPINHEMIFSHKQLKKLDGVELINLLDRGRQQMEQSDFTVEDLTRRLNGLLESTDQKPVVLFSLIRIAATRSAASPPLSETLALLGKKRSLKLVGEYLASLRSSLP